MLLLKIFVRKLLAVDRLAASALDTMVSASTDKALLILAAGG